MPHLLRRFEQNALYAPQRSFPFGAQLPPLARGGIIFLKGRIPHIAVAAESAFGGAVAGDYQGVISAYAQFLQDFSVSIGSLLNRMEVYNYFNRNFYGIISAWIYLRFV